MYGEEGRAKFIATIHELRNVRSSQPSTIAVRLTITMGSVVSMLCDTLLTNVVWFKSSLFSKTPFFKIKITMTHLVYICMWRDGGFVLKCRATYS